MDLNFSAMKDSVDHYSLSCNVDQHLVEAIIMVESAWCPWVTRYEPGWRYLYSPREIASHLNITADTETQAQMNSYGLGQMMGSVYRELGYMDYLTKVPQDYDLQIQYMCKKLRMLMERFGGKPESDIIASWNAGSPTKTPGGMYVNQGYVDRVSGELRKLNAIIP